MQSTATDGVLCRVPAKIAEQIEVLFRLETRALDGVPES